MKRLNLKHLALLAVLVIAPLFAFGAGGKHYTMSNGVLNTFFRTTAMSAPATVYVGLFSTCPTTTSLGTEVTGNGYQRGHYNGSSVVGITKGDAQWTYTAATSSNTTATIVNAGVVTFPAASSSSWTVNCFGIFDASTSGNLLYWGPVTGNPVTVSVGATASFAIGALTITES